MSLRNQFAKFKNTRQGGKIWFEKRNYAQSAKRGTWHGILELMRCLKFGDFWGVVQLICRPSMTKQKNKQFVTWDISSAQSINPLSSLLLSVLPSRDCFLLGQARLRSNQPMNGVVARFGREVDWAERARERDLFYSAYDSPRRSEFAASWVRP